MAKTQPRRPSHELLVELAALRARLALLNRTGARVSDLSRLRYDALYTLVEAQRKVIALHAEMLRMVRDDRDLYRQHRMESRALALGCDALRDLIRGIDRAMHAIGN